MYLTNKYTKYYFIIIERAKARPTITGYKEKHHIIPKCFGGSNLSSNLVSLTAKEHFVCHLLLTRMVPEELRYKMTYAIWMMTNKNKNQSSRYAPSAARYQKIREETFKCNKKKIPWSKGRKLPPLTEEHKRKVSIGNKGKVISQETRQKISAANKGKLKGRKLSAERIEQIRKYALQCGKQSAELIEKRIAPLRGQHRTQEQKDRIGMAVKKSIQYLQCEHCHKEFAKSMYMLWHGPKCKYRT